MFKDEVKISNSNSSFSNPYSKQENQKSNDQKILEHMLAYNVPRECLSEVASKLISDFGSLAKLFDADINDIINDCEYIDKDIAGLIKAIPMAMDIYLEEKQQIETPVNTLEKIASILIKKYLTVKSEVYSVIFLDDKNCMDFLKTFFDTLPSNMESFTRNAVKTILSRKNRKVIISHNKPNSNVFPTEYELMVIKRLNCALSYLNIEILDYITVSGSQYVSAKEAFSSAKIEK